MDKLLDQILFHNIVLTINAFLGWLVMLVFFLMILDLPRRCFKYLDKQVEKKWKKKKGA